MYVNVFYIFQSTDIIILINALITLFNLWRMEVYSAWLLNPFNMTLLVFKNFPFC